MCQFDSYEGASGNLYRVALDPVMYQGADLEALLAPAAKLEGGRDRLAERPGELVCRCCGELFEPDTVRFDKEEIGPVYCLPQP